MANAFVPRGKTMLKVTIVNTRRQRRLILEGTLVQPWVEELRRTWAAASVEPQARRLVVDLNDVTAISKDGEDVLSDFMRHGAKFSSCGVLTKYLLKQLTLKLQPRHNGTKNHDSSND
jgi:hypothetical protein